MDDLTEDERAAVIAAVHKALANDPFPLAPRLEALRRALAKLDPGSAPTRSRGGRRARRWRRSIGPSKG